MVLVLVVRENGSLVLGVGTGWNSRRRRRSSTHANHTHGGSAKVGDLLNLARKRGVGKDGERLVVVVDLRIDTGQHGHASKPHTAEQGHKQVRQLGLSEWDNVQVALTRAVGRTLKGGDVCVCVWGGGMVSS